MKSALKIIVPLVVLVGVVFGITFVSRYTPSETDPKIVAASTERPLRFFTNERKWDPLSESLQDRIFPAFGEPGGPPLVAAFWFENRNPHPVVLQRKPGGCSTCSSGAVAAIPPAKTRALLAGSAQSVGLTALPFADPLGPALIRAVSGAGVAANLFDKLEWNDQEFGPNPQAAYEIPAAPGPTEPLWGILRLTVKPRAGAKIPVTTEFATQVKGTTQAGSDVFRIGYHAIDPYLVEPGVLNVGTFDDSSPPRTEAFTVYSLTRGPGEPYGNLDPPAVTVENPTAPGGLAATSGLVRAGTPEPLTPAELDALGVSVSQARKMPEGQTVRITAAYRVPVVVSPKLGAERLDIGQLERDIWVSVPNTPDFVRKKVTLKGTVTGEVQLADGKDALDLGQFSAAAGLPEKKFELFTTRPGVKLSVAKYDETDRDGKPVRTRNFVMDNGRLADDVLKVTVERQDRADPDREYYWLKVTIPPNAMGGNLSGSYVMLDVKGDAGRRIRIPIKGGTSGR